MDFLKWWEQRSSLVRAGVYTVSMLSGGLAALYGGKPGVIGAVLLYMTGWLSRHTQNPEAANLLDPDRHQVMDYHD